MTDFTGFTTSKGQEWLATVWTPFLAALTNFTNVFEGAAAVTSTESVAIGTGAKSWSAVSPNSPFAVGATVRAYSAADPTKYMVGQVTASSGASLAINATLSGGSGTVSDWIINAVFDIGFLPLAGGTVTGATTFSGLLTASGGLTLAGALTGGGNAIKGIEGAADIGSAVQPVGPTASNHTLDLETYQGGTIEPTGDIAFAASNYPAGATAFAWWITGGGDHTLDFSHFANSAALPTFQTGSAGDLVIGGSPDGGTTKLIYHVGTF